MNKFISLILIIFSPFIIFGQKDYTVIETTREVNVDNCKNVQVIKNPSKSITITNVYQPDLQIIEILEKILTKVDKLEELTEYRKNISKYNDTIPPYQVFTENIRNANKLIEKHKETIINDNTLKEDYIISQSINTSVSKIPQDDFIQIDEKSYGFNLDKLKENPSFVFLDDFSDGYARVQLNNRCSYVNRKGELVYPFTFDIESRNFSEGLAYVEIEYEGHFFINTGFQKVFAVSGLGVIEDFKNGIARYRKNYKLGILTKEGKILDFNKFFNTDNIKVESIDRLRNDNFSIKVNLPPIGDLATNEKGDLLLPTNKSCPDVYYYYIFDKLGDLLINVALTDFKLSWNPTINDFIFVEFPDETWGLFSEKNKKYILKSVYEGYNLYKLSNFREGIFSFSKSPSYYSDFAYFRIGDKNPFTKFKYDSPKPFIDGRAIVEGGLINNNGAEIVKNNFFETLKRKGDNYIGIFRKSKEYIVTRKKILFFKEKTKRADIVRKVIIDRNGNCLSGDCSYYNSKSIKK